MTPRTETEALRAALQEIVDQLDDYGPDGPGFRDAIENARAALASPEPIADEPDEAYSDD